MCVHAKGKPPKYGPKELLILRRILKTFKCTSIRLSSLIQQQHRHTNCIHRDTKHERDTQRMTFCVFHRKILPTKLLETKNPQNTTVRAAEIETGGQKKEDPTEFSSSKARNQLRQTKKSHTWHSGTAMVHALSSCCYGKNVANTAY